MDSYVTSPLAIISPLRLQVKWHGLGSASELPASVRSGATGITLQDETVLFTLEGLRGTTEDAIDAPPTFTADAGEVTMADEPTPHHLYYSIEVQSVEERALRASVSPFGGGFGGGFGSGGSLGLDCSPMGSPTGGEPTSPPTGVLPAPSVGSEGGLLAPRLAEAASLRAEVERSVASGGDCANALLLLLLLERALLPPAGGGSGGGVETAVRRLLASSRLSMKLLMQLSDALTIASGALPKWMPALLHTCPALFAHKARLEYCRSSAFGTSRALHWSREQEMVDMRHAYNLERGVLEAAREAAQAVGDDSSLSRVMHVKGFIEEEMERWSQAGRLTSTIAKVVRTELLSMAEWLMAHQVDSRSKRELEVQFEGESGFGTGVTQNFYSSVADELLKASVHAALPLWVTNSRAGSPAAGDDDEAVSGHISHAGELFPRPLPPGMPAEQIAAVCSRFRFLGRLMASACRDGFIVPLPLSRNFLHLVRGGQLTTAALPPCVATGGGTSAAVGGEASVVSAYALIAQRLAAIDAACAASAIDDAHREVERVRQYELVADSEFASSLLGYETPMSLRDFLDAVSRGFICPITNSPLCPGGADLELTVDSLQEYVRLVSRLWLADGVARQAVAFRAGIADVVQAPDVLLAPFSLAELQTLLCGTLRIEWSEVELRRALLPTSPLTRDSMSYNLLVGELMRMSHEQRAQFLNFVTACPHLPSVGLGELVIQVQPQEPGKPLPTAHTCEPSLRLPLYESAEELVAGLEMAFANIKAGGLHELTR
mmetsp:Transcript_17719/g.35731  ORF Transcript_17719/g.35731 Transcript_17719/m.35731 type:complete len:776 (-) Transcript_17719:348-2675(-)